ncbi:MAG: flagellar hook-basal body complex protein FliE [Gammaproteobacteria bacterium]|nr:flagellar hook-basal body complex protein FliE [Gammaproteobacteria bacterium]
MSEMNVNQLLAQMRSMASQVEQSSANLNVESPAGTNKPDFSNLLKQSIDSVNETQMTAAQLTTAFEKGDPDITLPEVMVALEKASVSFQAMTQVRNKLLSAYQEVMNMPV